MKYGIVIFFPNASLGIRYRAPIWFLSIKFFFFFFFFIDRIQRRHFAKRVFKKGFRRCT